MRVVMMPMFIMVVSMVSVPVGVIVCVTVIMVAMIKEGMLVIVSAPGKYRSEPAHKHSRAQDEHDQA